MLVRSSIGAGPLLFPKLGDAALAPAASTSTIVDAGEPSKVGDLATMLSLISSLVLILRR